MRLNEREVLGGTRMAGNNDTPVILLERDTKIRIQKEYHRIDIDAPSARVMARNLNRLALRIERRAAASVIEAAIAGETAQTGSTEGESAAREAGDAQ